MKQIIKIALALVALQVVLTKATPTSHRVVPADKDALMNMLGESYQNFLNEQMLQSGLKQIPLLKESIAVIESKMDGGDENITAEDIQDLKKQLDGFIETFEQWKADKTNCALQQDVRSKIWNLQLTIERFWREKYNKFVGANREKYDTEFALLRTEMLWVLTEYVKAMPENLPEKQTLKEAMEKSESKLCSAVNHYLKTEIDIEAPRISTACNNKAIAAQDFLMKMMWVE